MCTQLIQMDIQESSHNIKVNLFHGFETEALIRIIYSFLRKETHDLSLHGHFAIHPMRIIHQHLVLAFLHNAAGFNHRDFICIQDCT